MLQGIGAAYEDGAMAEVLAGRGVPGAVGVGEVVGRLDAIHFTGARLRVDLVRVRMTDRYPQSHTHTLIHVHSPYTHSHTHTCTPSLHTLTSNPLMTSTQHSSLTHATHNMTLSSRSYFPQTSSRASAL